MMSSGKARRVMLRLAREWMGSRTKADTKVDDTSPFIDLGSGWGTLVVALAREYPDRHIIGYELSWFPWLVSSMRKYCLGLNNLSLYRKNFIDADLNNASILFCYLFPGGMASLYEKLKKDVSQEVCIISNTFALPSCPSSQTVKLDDIYRSPIYVYKWLG
ncbi:hypothetical protein TDB9533_03195 [Thalassocella blandensis]|nr:hypothetical protein TDB9533_03195 [Thalassocella blandensis]